MNTPYAWFQKRRLRTSMETIINDPSLASYELRARYSPMNKQTQTPQANVGKHTSMPWCCSSIDLRRLYLFACFIHSSLCLHYIVLATITSPHESVSWFPVVTCSRTFPECRPDTCGDFTCLLLVRSGPTKSSDDDDQFPHISSAISLLFSLFFTINHSSFFFINTLCITVDMDLDLQYVIKTTTK
jgi:hypothetical protein